jgi:hypothetical protein
LSSALQKVDLEGLVSKAVAKEVDRISVDAVPKKSGKQKQTESERLRFFLLKFFFLVHKKGFFLLATRLLSWFCANKQAWVRKWGGR